MELILLSQDRCAPCQEVKLFLQNEEIEYTEINVSKNPEAIQEYYVQSAPTVILVNEDGEEEGRVIGKNHMDEILDLANEL